MDNPLMTNEENYAFDVAGYLHIPGVLNQEEVAALNEALDTVGDSKNLLGRVGYTPRIVPRSTCPSKIGVVSESDCRTRISTRSGTSRLLGQRDGEIGMTLRGGDEPRNPSQAYFLQNGQRSSQGVEAIWVLDDVKTGDGGLVVVQASHKSNVETPRRLGDRR